MKKVVVLLICAFFLSIGGRAQINLVRNGSFEQHTMCPDNYDEAKYCNHWMGIDTTWNPPDWAHVPMGIPDFCHVCATYSGVTVPSASRYTHYPRTGSGMMQVQTLVNLWDTSYARDYLHQQFPQVLNAGHIYNVILYATLEQASIFAHNNIGVYFDDGMIDTTHHPSWTQTQYTPQILDTNIINDTLSWVRIEDTFTATGTEKFMTIGNFFDRAHTNMIAVKTFSTLAISWYLIDDVSVIDCANEPHAGNDTVIHPGDSAFLGPQENLLPYTWYKLGSGTAIDSGGGIWVKPTVTTTYVLKQELCGVTKMDTVKVWVWPDTPTSVGSQQLVVNSLRVYPNPATNEVTVEGAKGCEVAFYDVVGRKIACLPDRQASYFTMTNKEVVDISKLPNGVYFVKITDALAGDSITRRLLKE